MLEKIVVVLCNTSHAGNIGSVARAMKTMGIYRLILVNPKASHLSEEAVALASSAVDVLHGAKVVHIRHR